MESVVAPLATGVLTLIGVLVSNSRSHTVMEVKIDNPTQQIERHSRLIERIYTLKQDVAAVEAEIENMWKGQCGCNTHPSIPTAPCSTSRTARHSSSILARNSPTG